MANLSTLEHLAEHLSARGRAGEAAGRMVALHVADTATAWIAGALSPEGRMLMRFVPAAGRDERTVLDGVMLHCALARLSEIDDIHLGSCTTPGAIVIPAALTLAAARNASTHALSEAILAGYEAIVRLGAALNGPAILYRGIWPTYFCAPFGVAAAAARLLELDPRRTAHALALALVSSSPGVGHQSGPNMARWLAVGHAARHGGMAALAAQAGFTADVGLLESSFLSSVYAVSPRLSELTEALGTRCALDAVSFKPWCAARQTMAATQALKEMAREGLAVDEISAIRVGVPPPTLRMVNHGAESEDRSSRLTSLPYQMASGVLEPQTQYSIAPAGRIADSVRALMAKITVQADERLLEHYPSAWSARVTVSARSGDREKLLLHVPGDPQRAFGAIDVADKCTRVLTPLLGDSAAAQMIDRLLAALDTDPARVLAEIDMACRD